MASFTHDSILQARPAEPDQMVRKEMAKEDVASEDGPRHCPADSFHVRMADFDNLSEALDYAALAGTGMNFYAADGSCTAFFTYDNLRLRARMLAQRLLGLGLSRGDRVGIIADMHPDFVAMFFACQYAGLLAVPLPVVTGLGGRQGYQKQLALVLETSGARAAFGSQEVLEHLRDAAYGLPVTTICTPDDLQKMPASKSTLKPLQKDEPSHIQYSSGSTRNPLGIEISQHALMDNARSISRHGVQFTTKERIASWLPYYHDMGLIGCLIVPLTCQLTVDYLHTDAFARRPLQWLKMISNNRCTISFSPTFGYDLCTRRAAGKTDLGFDLSSWRYAGIGGDMIQPDVFTNFAKAFSHYGFKAQSLTPSYGLAEATLAFSFGKPGAGVTADAVDKYAMAEKEIAEPFKGDPLKDSTKLRAFASCGRPMPGYKVEIRNDENKAVHDRHIGGVFIYCNSLMNGYYRNPEATRNCIGGDGWLDTGDMGYMVEGELFITGRKKDMMIINGRNIWPQDLEWYAENNVEELRRRDTAVFAIELEDGKEAAMMLVQCRLQGHEEREALKKIIHAVVVRNTGIDCRIELVPQRSLPFTTSGKLSRAKARQLWLEGAFNPSNIVQMNGDFVP